jgi:hypothetical protein
VTPPAQNPALDFFHVSQCEGKLDGAVLQLLDLLRWMPLPFLDPWSGEGIEYNSNRVLGFCWPGENPKALFEIPADRKIRGSPKPRFTCSHTTNSRQSKGAQLSPIDVESEQLPKILDTTQVVGLHVALLITGGSRFLVIEAQLDLFENGVAQLFEYMNVSNRSPRTPERYC